MACVSVSSTTAHYAYKPNTVLRATFLENSDAVIGMPGASKSLKEVELKVIRTLATTLSCVLLVEPMGTHKLRFPRPLILKVFDARFADNIRDENKMPEWTPAHGILHDEFKVLPAHLKPAIISDEYDPNSKWWDEEGDESPPGDSGSATQGTAGRFKDSTRESGPIAARQAQGRTSTAKQTPEPPDADDWEKVEPVPDSDSDSQSDTESVSEMSSAADDDDDDEPERIQLISMEEADRALRGRLHPGFLEAVGELSCENMHRNEVKVYQQLSELQGKTVPGCYGSVSIQSSNTNPALGRYTFKALLLQYIDNSFTLRDIPEKVANKELWSDIGKAAVKLVQDIGDLGVLNRDVRLDNFLVVPVARSKRAKRNASKRKGSPDRVQQSEHKKFRVVMIDFGLARVWDEDEETEEDFRKCRLFEDEEGAVGYVLQMHLSKALKVIPGTEESPFRYRPSNRLRRSWDDEDDC